MINFIRVVRCGKGEVRVLYLLEKNNNGIVVFDFVNIYVWVCV